MKKRRTKVHNKVVFKRYIQDEPLLFPERLEEYIPENDIVRIVNDLIENMDLNFLYRSYKGGGRSSYHPKMLLKVIVYAYTQKIYSSRKIAKALRENIYFMWLSGKNYPDFRTINKFRKEKLGRHLEEIFSILLSYLYETGYVDLNNYFLDGTKIEANANKYSFVWSKSIKNYKKKLKENVKKLLKEIDYLNEEEDRYYEEKESEESKGKKEVLDSEKLKKIAKELEEVLKEGGEDKKDKKSKQLKKSIKKLKQDYIPRLERYEEQEKKFKGRNSYSKTDEEATFMRMKEDAMLNGQLKAGYNVQIGTQNQFILWYSIHQDRSDTNTLIPHLESLILKTGRKPTNLITDAGYGSTYNYLYLKRRGINNYVKYSGYFKESKRSFKKDKLNRQNWKYDESKDCFICANGKELKYVYTARSTKRKKLELYKVYSTNGCKGCIYQDRCSKGKPYKNIWVNPVFLKLKSEVKSNLSTLMGQELSFRRKIEVETVFGDIKHNMGFRRFMLRGINNVKIEWGLISIAHNIRKLFKFNKGKVLPYFLYLLNNSFKNSFIFSFNL